MPRMIELDAIGDTDEKRQWDTWLNGEPWVFEKGVDYFGPQRSFINRVRYQANKRGLRIKLASKTADAFTAIAYMPGNKP